MNFFARSALIVSAIIAAIPASGLAATTVGSPDAAFARKAAQAGMTEVQLAELAMQKSQNPAVLSFAREMRTDHGKANAQLLSIVRMQGLTPPSTIGAKNEQLMTKLSALHGAAFNSSYLDSQLPAHRQVLSLFQREVATGTDSALVAFAKQTIPVIEHHIAMDRRDIARVGGTVGMMPANH